MREQERGLGQLHEASEKRVKAGSYHVEAAVRAFEKVLPSRDRQNPERTQTLTDTLNRFVEKEIENIQVFKTKDGAAFPYTTLNITELAKQLYTERSGQELPSQTSQDASRRKEYVVFGSFPSVQNGHPFTFTEVAMQQMMRHLGSLMQGIESGKPLPEVRVTTLGSPFNNRWGEVTPEYVAKVQEDPFGTLGHSYAEMLRQNLAADSRGREKTAYRFEGVSMGGRLAIKAAEELVQKGLMTQDHAERHGPNAKPFVQVLVDSAPGVNNDVGQNRVKFGFIGEIGIQTLRHPSTMLVALKENKFLNKVAEKLQKRGIKTNDSKEQLKLKKEATKSVVNALGKPAETPSIAVDSRRGMNDPLLYSHFWKRAARRELEAGRIPVETNNGTREWAINATHLFPFYPRGEMRAWKNSIDVARKVTSKKT